jgi:hypothetical protein
VVVRDDVGSGAVGLARRIVWRAPSSGFLEWRRESSSPACAGLIVVTEEWCLTAELDGDQDEISGVLAALSELPEYQGGFTRQGGVLRLYTDSESAAAAAEEILLGILAETALGYEVWQQRWDAEAGAWEELAPEAEPEIAESELGDDERP